MSCTPVFQPSVAPRAFFRFSDWLLGCENKFLNLIVRALNPFSISVQSSIAVRTILDPKSRQRLLHRAWRLNETCHACKAQTATAPLVSCLTLSSPLFWLCHVLTVQNSIRKEWSGRHSGAYPVITHCENSSITSLQLQYVTSTRLPVAARLATGELVAYRGMSDTTRNIVKGLRNRNLECTDVKVRIRFW